MKLCPKCNTSRVYEDFYKCSKNKDGLQAYCKPCIKLANTSWASENKEKFKEYYAKFRATEKRKAYVANYKEVNKEAIRKGIKAYKKKNRELLLLKGKEYREENKDKVRESNRRYVLANKEKVLLSSKSYREKNRPKYAAYAAKRRVVEERATPSWLSKDDHKRIELAWGLRELKSFVTGDEYEVDHIVPLNSKLVCGLHVPWNLRVIPKVDNRRKLNRHWPDMWKVD